MYWALILIAAAIIISLSTVAGYYLLKLKKVKQQQNQQAQENQQAWIDKQEELASDIRFIANSMLQKQCEITEGCLRLKVLMDRLDENLQHQAEFKTIQLHYQQTSNMPHHHAYKALTKKQQFKQDQLRFQLEEQHRSQVLIEAKLLSGFQFNHPNARP